MTMAEQFSSELQQEAKATRRVFENIPDGKWDWKPHEKSLTLGRLAGHVADIHQWVHMIVNQSELVLDTSAKPTGFAGTSKDELLKAFDDNLAMGMEALKGKPDSVFAETWKFIVDGHIVIDMPKGAVLRVWVMSHAYHHRGQLSVYLRLNDAPVPAIYGPSADEQSF